MAIPIGNEGSFNSTNAVTVLAAPASSKQRVIPTHGLSVYNADTAAVDVIVQKNKNSTARVIYKKVGLAAGATDSMPNKVVLDATDESLEVKLGGAIATTQPVFDVAAAEYP